MERKIIHIDIDAFYASVEEIDNPSLKGKPVIVGGGSERGVVCTANYIARKYGIHSAMPGFKAKKLCHNGIFLPVRMDRYKEVSREVFKIFYGITPLVEPLSIDEAFLDVTNLDVDPLNIARYIKREVKKKTGLTVSVGVSYNKFLSKLASDWNKPDGLMVITEDMIPDILLPLPVKKVYGIGRVTKEKLNKRGIFTISDLYKLPRKYLYDEFGKGGYEIYDRIRGVDDREVSPERERKSYGKETTLRENTTSKEELFYYIKDFCRSISNMLKRENLYGRTITLKIKTGNFKNHSKSKTLDEYIREEKDIEKVAKELLDSIELVEEIRLIGVTVSNLEDIKAEQLSFF